MKSGELNEKERGEESGEYLWSRLGGIDCLDGGHAQLARLRDGKARQA
jgi:hypothetical protein